MIKKTSIFLLLFLPLFSFAQREKWKSYRYDIVFGLGASNFLGELGGAPQVGTHAFRDFDLSSTREAASLGLRYRVGEYTCLRSNFTYGRIHGDDKKTEEYYRRYRNLNFSSNVWEFTTQMEVSFMKEQMGRKYRMRGVRGKRGYEIFSYGFAGLGVFGFNPITHDGKKKVKLQSLHTEGQDLLPSRKHYHRVAICVPFGIGLKYSLGKSWSIGLEYGLRYTFTDYIDDVSTTYADPKLLASQTKVSGDLAAKMANRSNNGDPYGADAVPGNTYAGGQRGDPRYNDAYMFALITLNYKLKATRGNLPKF